MSFEYEYMGQKVVLEQDEDVVAVHYKEPATHSTRAAVAAGAKIGLFGNRYEVSRENLLSSQSLLSPNRGGQEQIHDSFAEFMDGAYAKLKGGVRFYRPVDKVAVHESVQVRKAKDPGYNPPNLQ